MAKLPDIQIRRGVPVMRSGAQAKLGNELRGIQAGVQAVDTGVRAIDQVVESEAKLDATRRFQEARRDYTRKRADLVLDYHTTDKPMENFQQDLSSLRREAFDTQAPQGGRAQRYYAPDRDAFMTQAVADEVSTFQQLADSRSKLHLTVSSQELVNEVGSGSTSPEMAIADFELGLKGTSLGLEEEELYRVKHYTAVMTESITGLTATGDPEDLEEAGELLASDAFKKVPQRQQLALEAEVTKAAYSSMDNLVNTTANNLLIAQGDLSELGSALSRVEGDVRPMTFLNSKEQDDLIRASQGEMAFRYFRGQLINGNVRGVKTALDSGDYSSMLSTAQTDSLMKSITSGQAGSNVNGMQVGLSHEINDYIAALNSGEYVDENSRAGAETAMDKLRASYYAAGKDQPDKSYFELEKKLEDAYRINAIQVETNQNPQATSSAIQASVGDDSDTAVNTRGEYRKALSTRAALLETDAIGMFKRSQGTVPPILPITAEGHLASLSTRFTLHDSLVLTEGEGISGPLEPHELQALSKAMNVMDTQDLLTYAGLVSNEVGETNAVAMFEQLNDDTNMNVVPAAARMASFGQQADATTVLTGAEILQSPKTDVKPNDMTKVVSQIQAALGGTYGEDYDMYYRTVDAVKAHYAGTLMGPGTRGDFSYNSDLVTNSIKKVTGGLLEVDGRKYTAPDPSWESDDLDWWMRSVDASILPNMADTDGNAIPADEVRDQLYDGNIFTSARFEFVSAGSPGLYHIQDNRSQSLGGVGGLAYDGDRPGQLATIRARKSDMKGDKPPRTYGGRRF